MPNYTPGFPTRGEVEVPEVLVSEVLQDLPQSSAVMALSRTQRLSSRTTRQRILSALPEAYFLGSDTELKQVTSMDWSHFNYEVAEIASLVALPDALVDDEDIPLWAEIRPRLVEAIGKAIDGACLYGVSRPSVWTTPAIVPGAIAAGNTVVHGSGSTAGSDGTFRQGHDIAANLAKLGGLLAEQGHVVDGWVTGPGFEYRLYMERDANGQPIYGPPQGTNPGTIFGLPNPQVKNGAWQNAKALAIAGDFSRSLIGIRQDITFTMHTDAVITDDAGKVVFNAMQQDSKILRVVTRLAHVVVSQDMNALAGTDHYPFALLQPNSTADYNV